MSWHEGFTDALKALARDDDRAALASLRRSLDGETQTFAGAARVIARYLPRQLDRWEEDDAYLVAALFALAPSTSGLRLASALRRVAQSTGSSSIELRFTAMLASGREDLPTHLRHAVTLVRGAGVDLDWAALLRDVLRWGAPAGSTQKTWAREFWGSNEADNSNPQSAEGTSP